MGHQSPSVSTKTSPVASKAPAVIPEASSSSVAADASSVTVTVWPTGVLESNEPVAVVVGEVSVRELSVGEAVRETVSLGNAHYTQTPVLVYRWNTDEVTECMNYEFMNYPFTL